MNNIDEVSSALGSLTADMKHIKNATRDILTKVDTTNEEMIVQRQNIKTVHKRLDDIEPKVNAHETIKNKALGAVTLAGFVGGVITYLGQLVLKVIF